MIQRVNSLGRKRIRQTCIVIEVFDGSPRTFNAEINLGDHNFPETAFVGLKLPRPGHPSCNVLNAERLAS